MADNINFNEQTQKHAFYSRAEIAWHRKGQISKEYLTSTEVLNEAQLNFDVEKRPNIHELPDGRRIVSDSSFYTCRLDNGAILGDRLSKEYVVLQNAAGFGFFDETAGEHDIKYETAGALGKGERVFITAKLPQHITVGGKDVSELYLFMSNSHDGSDSLTIALTPIRIVCNNTLNAAMANCQNRVRIRHSGDMDMKLKEARRVMDMVNKATPVYEEVFNEWAKIPITDQQVKNLIIQALAPDNEVLADIKAGNYETMSTRFKNTLDAAYSYAFGNETQLMPTTAGKVFGAYNAITGFFQNVQNYKDSDAKIKSILFEGHAANKAQKAFDLCHAFAQYGPSALLLN